MKKIAIATVLVALASAARLAALPPSESACCACLEGFLGQTGQAGNNETLREAVFCASQPPGSSDLGERCSAVTDGSGIVLCIVGDSNETCRTQLADGGIACPSSGVPAAAPLNLVALAVTLGAAGIAILRRRSRRAA